MDKLQRFCDWVHSAPSLFEEVPPFTSLRHLSSKAYLRTPYSGNPRLGFIYQYLCTKQLEASKQYVVEIEELQLNDEQGKTLGAIDLVLLNTRTHQHEHWEVAVKFYLLHQGTWYGPNAHDQLDKKLSRMLNHQLKMSRSYPFLQKNPRLAQVSEHLLLQGRLYINPFDEEPIPDNCLGYKLNQSQISGYWCYESQRHRVTEELFTLEKVEWAAGTSSYSSTFEHLHGNFAHTQTKTGQFWFIVKDGWPL
ncbi:DUF1853 family protein [Vibrio astriarenae]|uniref:DUF1853 family protein n=1 Tax=Vibrio astriarenae TaxID=1481923 RepID=UPI00373637F0